MAAELGIHEPTVGKPRAFWQLEADIRTLIDVHNKNPKPFKWTKSADQILASAKRFCHKGQQTLCGDFRACRCFRKELRRVILAFAARTASVLVSCCFGCGVLATFPTVGIMGSAEANIDARPIGWVLIGPVGFDVPLGILDNSLRSNLFNRGKCEPASPADK